MMLEPESPDGAHDDVLEAAEGGRRDFLKQVLAGAAFAAPLMASFSMDGMSTEEAEGAIGPYSSYCPDLPGDTKPCCALANCIANELVQLAQRAKTKMNAATPRLPSLARAQVHNKVAVAQAELTAGMIEGDDLCSSFEAKARYAAAKLALEELLDILDQIDNDHEVDLELSSQVQVAINDLQQLLDTEC